MTTALAIWHPTEGAAIAADRRVCMGMEAMPIRGGKLQPLGGTSGALYAYAGTGWPSVVDALDECDSAHKVAAVWSDLREGADDEGAALLLLTPGGVYVGDSRGDLYPIAPTVGDYVIASIGSGGEFARGAAAWALEHGSDDACDEPSDIARRAVGIACDCDAGSGHGVDVAEVPS